MEVKQLRAERGSVELIVIGLLAALIIVLAIPLLKDIGEETEHNLEQVRDEMMTIRDEQDKKHREYDKR